MTVRKKLKKKVSKKIETKFVVVFNEDCGAERFTSFDQVVQFFIEEVEEMGNNFNPGSYLIFELKKELKIKYKIDLVGVK